MITATPGTGNSTAAEKGIGAKEAEVAMQVEKGYAWQGSSGIEEDEEEEVSFKGGLGLA